MNEPVNQNLSRDDGSPPNEDYFLKGLLAFQNHDFFEAHDFFEEAWNEMTGTEKMICQAIIQITVSIYHYSAGNSKGASGLAMKASSKLKSLPDSFQTAHIAELHEVTQKWSESFLSSENELAREKLIGEFGKILIPGFRFHQ